MRRAGRHLAGGSYTAGREAGWNVFEAPCHETTLQQPPIKSPANFREILIASRGIEANGRRKFFRCGGACALPAFAEMFFAHLLGRSIRMEADLVDQLFNSGEKRLARLLLLLANFGKEWKPEPILATISQETLAEMIGTTRSRVSFFMNKFRKLGFIHYNGGIQVHSSLLNIVLHDEPHINA
jgi:CRP-like cAMP-binding protein